MSIELKLKIKVLHSTDFECAYCVTDDDEVYGFGENILKYLGYNENHDNNSYVLIHELCDKSIEQFFGEKDVFFARSQTNIYSWGVNDHAQLGKGYTSQECLVPDKNEYFSDKKIIEITENCRITEPSPK